MNLYIKRERKKNNTEIMRRIRVGGDYIRANYKSEYNVCVRVCV